MVHDALAGYWAGRWPGEDGGSCRRQVAHVPTNLELEGPPTVVSRTSLACTMVIWRSDELFLLSHSAGDDAVAWVEQLDPQTLSTIRRSPDLVGGPAWPGGVVAHANGDLYVTFGRHVHRLSAQLEVLVSRRLPRHRPYNSLVVLGDGSLVMKDFGGARPGEDAELVSDDCEVCVVDPTTLEVLSTVVVPEASVARLSADGDSIYVVGVTSLWRVRWDPDTKSAELDRGFRALYRTREGEGYGWDAVLVDGSAWFLNNGAGSQAYQGTLRGLGVAIAPESVVRVDLSSGDVKKYEVCALEGGLVANPPAVDASRHVVVGYDSGNGVVTAWDYRSDTRLWTVSLDHGAHPLLFPDEGVVVVNDFDGATDHCVALSIETGVEVARVDTGSPVQSVLFLAPGRLSDWYYCSFTTVSRISFAGLASIEVRDARRLH